MSKSEPELFRRMSEPFPNAEEADAALEKFYAGVSKLREEHRIANVYVRTHVYITGKTGEYVGASSMFLGDSGQLLPMVATAFGEERERHVEMIGAMASGRKRR